MNDDEDLIYDQTLLLRKETKPSGYTKWCQKFSKTMCLSLAFFTLGLCIAIPGPTLLDLGDQVNTDTTHMALIFSARSVGYLLGALIGGFLFDIFEKQLLLTATLLVAAVATMIIPWSLTLVILAVMFSLQGVAMGVLDTGGNVFCIRLWGAKSAPYMQALHFAFGIGAFIAPLIAQPFLSTTNSTTTSVLQGNVPVINSNVIDTALFHNITHNDRTRRDEPDFHNPFVNTTTKAFENGTTHTAVKITTSITTTTTATPKVKKPSVVKGDILPNQNNRDGGQILNHMKTHLTIDDQAKLATDAPTKASTSKTVNDDDKNMVKNDSKRIEPGQSDDLNSTASTLTESETSVAVTQDNNTNTNSSDTVSVKPKTVSSSTTTPNSITTTPTSTTTTPTTTKAKPSTNATTPTTTKATPTPSSATPTTSKTTPTTTKAVPTTTKAVPTTTTTTPITTKATHTTTKATPTTSKINPTTTTKASTTKKPSDKTPVTKKPTGEIKPTTPSVEDQTTMNASDTTTMYISTTTVHKPKTVGDLVNNVIDSVKNMSKIQFAYSIIGILLFLSSTMFLVLYCFTKHKRDPEESDEFNEISMRSENNCVRLLTLVLSFFFFLCYVGMETTFGGLIMTFAVEFAHWTKPQGAIVTAIFWGSLAVGRGFAIFLSNCCRPRTMLIIDLVFTVIGTLILAFGVQQLNILLWLGTVFLGIGLSSIFPTSVTWVNEYFKITGKSTAVFVTGSGIGQMVLPVVTGYLYQNYNKQYLMYIILCLSVLTVVLYIVMQCLASKAGKTNSSGFLRLDDLDTEMDGGNYSSTQESQRRKFMPVHNGYDLLMQDAEEEF